MIFRLSAVSRARRALIPLHLKRASSSGTQCYAVMYRNYGDPSKVLYGEHIDLPALSEGKVLLKMLAAPINPADINMIQGVYPVKPPALPAVGGNESVSEVLELGAGVKTLKVGDWVIPADSGSGTWRTHTVANETDLVKVANDIPTVCAATLTVNPRTAYRMLKDFEDMNPGDTVIQNGANSGVGQAVIQIAAEMGLKTINIVRDRPDINGLIAKLSGLGATHVVTDEMLKKQDTKDLLKSLRKPKLALNCVGGRASAELMKYLQKKGTMVTYGGMSKQPLMIPAGPLIFNDVKVKGFWVTQWTRDNFNTPERKQMQDHLTDMIKKGVLKAPFHKLANIKHFEIAISNSMTSYSSEKQILTNE